MMLIKIGEYYIQKCYADKYDHITLTNKIKEAKQFTEEEATLWVKLLKNLEIR